MVMRVVIEVKVYIPNHLRSIPRLIKKINQNFRFKKLLRVLEMILRNKSRKKMKNKLTIICLALRLKTVGILFLEREQVIQIY